MEFATNEGWSNAGRQPVCPRKGDGKTNTTRAATKAEVMKCGQQFPGLAYCRLAAARGGKAAETKLLAFVIAAVLPLAFQPIMVSARQCTTMPSPPENSSALINASNTSATPPPLRNSSLVNSTGNASSSAPGPDPRSPENAFQAPDDPTRPSQAQQPPLSTQSVSETDDIQIEATPISSKLDRQAAEITADMDAMNQVYTSARAHTHTLIRTSTHTGTPTHTHTHSHAPLHRRWIWIQ